MNEAIDPNKLPAQVKYRVLVTCLGADGSAAELLEFDNIDNPHIVFQVEPHHAAEVDEATRQEWASGKWDLSMRGNPYLTTDDHFHVVVYRGRSGAWVARVTDNETEHVRTRGEFGDE